MLSIQLKITTYQSINQSINQSHHTCYLVEFPRVRGVENSFGANDVRRLSGQESGHGLADVGDSRQSAILKEMMIIKWIYLHIESFHRNHIYSSSIYYYSR